MKVAIHNRPGSFSDRWIEYCKHNGIEHKIVNAYDYNIVDHVKGCDVFMWHHNHGDYRDSLFAKQLLYSLEESGIKVYPDWHTTWHFDDKVGQKYLLESIGAPIVPSYVFYTKEEAIKWIHSTSFPKVFKLRGGAGAANVKLVRNKRDAISFVKRAFGRGFPMLDRAGYLKERFNKWRQGKDTFIGVLKGLARLFIPTTFSKMHPHEMGYVYFQDFIFNDYHDIRIKIVEGKAILIQRSDVKSSNIPLSSNNLCGDLGSHLLQSIKKSFEIYSEQSQKCVGFDYVIAEGEPRLVNVINNVTVLESENNNGYWTNDMVWHEGQVTFHRLSDEHAIINKDQHLLSYITDYNKFDLRVVVIDDKAFAERRYCRKGDFRASGSGNFEYVNVDNDILKLAFGTADRLKLQTVAFDFIFYNNKPLIVEMCYAFGIKGLSRCPGYWTKDYVWHSCQEMDICGLIIKTMIRE